MASALLLLGGCDDAKYGVIRHAVYFTDAEDSPQKSVVIEESGGRIPITVRSVGRVESDVTVHCVVDPPCWTTITPRRAPISRSCPKRFTRCPKAS